MIFSCTSSSTPDPDQWVSQSVSHCQFQIFTLETNQSEKRKTQQDKEAKKQKDKKNTQKNTKTQKYKKTNIQKIVRHCDVRAVLHFYNV